MLETEELLVFSPLCSHCWAVSICELGHLRTDVDGNKKCSMAVKPFGLVQELALLFPSFSWPSSSPWCWLVFFDTADTLHPPSCWRRAYTFSSNDHPFGFSSRITLRPWSKGNTPEERVIIWQPCHRLLSLGWLPPSSSLVVWLTMLFYVSPLHSMRVIFQHPAHSASITQLYSCSPLSLWYILDLELSENSIKKYHHYHHHHL